MEKPNGFYNQCSSTIIDLFQKEKLFNITMLLVTYSFPCVNYIGVLPEFHFFFEFEILLLLVTIIFSIVRWKQGPLEISFLDKIWVLPILIKKVKLLHCFFFFFLAFAKKQTKKKKTIKKVHGTNCLNEKWIFQLKCAHPFLFDVLDHSYFFLSGKK